MTEFARWLAYDLETTRLRREALFKAAGSPSAVEWRDPAPRSYWADSMEFYARGLEALRADRQSSNLGSPAARRGTDPGGRGGQQGSDREA